METQKQTQHSEFQLDEVNGVSMAVIECHNVGGHQCRMGLTDEMEKRLDIAENVVITVADLNAVGEEMFLRAAEEEKEGARGIEGLIERVGEENWLNALEAGLTFILTDERNM